MAIAGLSALVYLDHNAERRLLHILDTYSAEEFANRFEWLHERW